MNYNMVKNHLDKATNAFLDNIERYYNTTEKPIVKTVTENRYSYSYIRVLKLIWDSRVSTVYLKRIVHTRPEEITRNQLEIECNLIKRLTGQFTDCSKYANSIVRQVACFPEYIVTVTEECTGDNFQDFIGEKGRWYHYPFMIDEMEDYCRSSGEWLKLFHHFTKKSNVSNKEVFDWIKGEIIWRIRLLKNKKTTLVSFLEKVFNKMVDDLSSACVDNVLVTGMHGDYAPHNIFVEHGLIRIIDFSEFKYGSNYCDVINFVSKLSQLKASPLYKNIHITRCQEAFIRGYGNFSESLTPLGCIIKVMYAIRILYHIILCPEKSPIRFFIQHRLFKNNLKFLERYLYEKNLNMALIT